MGYFDDIIVKTAVTDEADRTALLALTEKNPALKNLIDKRSQDAEAWEEWKRNNWNEDLKMTNETAAAVRDAEAAKLRVAALEAAGMGGDMKFEDIEKELAAKGYIRKDDLASVADPTIVNRVNQSAAGIERFYTATSTLPVEYFQEFGKVNPALMTDLVKKYGEEVRVNPAADPRAIYDRMVAPQREEIRVAKEAASKVAQEQAIKEAEERGAARARQEIGMQPGTPGMPVDDYGTPSLNARQNRIDAADKAGHTLEKSILERPLGSTAADGLAWIQAQRNASHSVQ